MKDLLHRQQPKRYVEGTHRACSPIETFERNWPKAQQIGVTRLADVTRLDVIGLPVWICIRPNSRGLATSQGKGVSSICAKVSALMESIENWHGENIALPLRHDSYENLSKSVVASRVSTLATLANTSIGPSTPLLWIEGFDLFSQAPVWVPFETVSTNYALGSAGLFQPAFLMSSNGLASGNSLDEAVAHALAEVIERDAIERCSAAVNRADSKLRLNVDSVSEPQCRKLLDMLSQAGILCSIYDITSAAGIPAYACTIVDADAGMTWRTLPAFSGYGCHPAPEIALSRAISEAIQSRLTHISGSRDDIAEDEYKSRGNPDDLNAHRAQMLEGTADVQFDSRLSMAQKTFAGDIQGMLAGLRKLGVAQAIVVDLTREKMAVPVVKVVVPGLRVPPQLMGVAVRQGRLNNKFAVDTA